ncbi:exportin-7-like isoform X2 [Watersipora subatra]|uniref:exportin-7-like isoform X2 n=1 Tax=Watersipora subatra TaxID=2589382 RepID=UPI00355BCA91
MAQDQEILQLENLCKELYETQDPHVRNAAEKALVNFPTSSDSLQKCQLLLERAATPYSQLLGATTLTKLVNKSASAVNSEQRLKIKDYVLEYLGTRTKLQGYVQQALIQLYARITKIGWNDMQKQTHIFRTVTQDLGKFLQSGSTVHVTVGVQLMTRLVVEMNQMTETEVHHSITWHRKISFSFRDQTLYQIFEIACELLKNAHSSAKNLDFNDSPQHNLMSGSLQLALTCLTYDFIGTSSDETSDDLSTVHMPTNWRKAMVDFSLMQLLFDLYKCLPPTLSAIAISCLVQLASIRRSFYINSEKTEFLNKLVTGVKTVLESPQGLSEPSCYHEFCRLLARLKSNFQLGELVRCDSYRDVIKLVAEFTITSLQMWQFAPNSIYYVLALWQRLVMSIPYVKASEPHMLETYTPEVTKAYITSRLGSVAQVVQDNLEDPLDDFAVLSQQLEQLSQIGRCQYEKTCTQLVQLFDEAARKYQEQAGRDSAQLTIQEGILSWLVYIIGAQIGGRVSFSSTDEHDEMDGELVCRVLQLMGAIDSRLAQRGCEKLDLALLYFIEQFRKIYIGEQVQRTSKVYKCLQEVLGLSEESMVLSVFIRKIITNLKYWANSEIIISKTLQLLNDLCVGYSSVRKLVKLETVQYVLTNHNSENFPFLGANGMATLKDTRCRTTFYMALGRLLMVDLGEDEDRFDIFMRPLTNMFDAVAQMLSQAETPMFRSEECKRSLIGLARDLRGVAYAFNTKTSYMMLYEWLYPNYFPVLLRGIELWYHEPVLTTPILKLMCELAQNRSQRLQFDVSSPNGVLLFREISKLLVAYGSRILTLASIPKEQLYPMKMKGISVCFNMLKAALCGNYVNFGVIRLYGDRALDDALDIFVKTLMSIPQTEILLYPKLSQSYYALLECLASDHMAFISNLEPQVFLYILSTISDGLSAFDTMVSTGCCSILDNIVTFLFKKLTKKGKSVQDANGTPNGASLVQILEMRPEILQQMLSTVLNIIMFEDCRNQWSMSRPLLGLVLLNEEYFGKLRGTLLANQPIDKQPAMERCFSNLMEGIEYSLLSKNRDKFTQNLSVFRRDVNDSLKSDSKTSSVVSTSVINGSIDMM